MNDITVSEVVVGLLFVVVVVGGVLLSIYMLA